MTPGVQIKLEFILVKTLLPESVKKKNTASDIVCNTVTCNTGQQLCSFEEVLDLFLNSGLVLSMLHHRKKVSAHITWGGSCQVIQTDICGQREGLCQGLQDSSSLAYMGHSYKDLK